ncbi:MAG TPA: hypothetical protein VGO47_04840 [Chlamydiales bacterium]|nr:hypothetical protein [Chlamydiales bacterium]
MSIFHQIVNMTSNSLQLYGLGPLSSPFEINEDAYSAPGGPDNLRLPTAGRRARSSSPDDEDSDRASKRRRSPSDQVDTHLGYFPSPERPRPHQHSPTRRRQSGSSRTNLPEFIEGSSRGLMRERRRRISRRSSLGPPGPVANGPPPTSRDAEEQREAEELSALHYIHFISYLT